MPAKWEERDEVSSSRFEILKWLYSVESSDSSNCSNNRRTKFAKTSF